MLVPCVVFDNGRTSQYHLTADSWKLKADI